MRWAGNVAKRHTGLWWENLKERDHLGDLNIDRSVILQTDFKEILRESVDWMNMAQDWEKWPTVVNAVLNLRIP